MMFLTSMVILYAFIRPGFAGNKPCHIQVPICVIQDIYIHLSNTSLSPTEVKITVNGSSVTTDGELITCRDAGQDILISLSDEFPRRYSDVMVVIDNVCMNFPADPESCSKIKKNRTDFECRDSTNKCKPRLDAITSPAAPQNLKDNNTDYTIIIPTVSCLAVAVCVVMLIYKRWKKKNRERRQVQQRDINEI